MEASGPLFCFVKAVRVLLLTRFKAIKNRFQNKMLADGGPLSLGLIPAFKRRLRCGIKMKILRWIGTHGQLSFVEVTSALNPGTGFSNITIC